jgi:poly-gamma-glutamate synthesis protein (capsule biosynthesis protein)
VPTYRRTGNEGAVRAFLTDADLAMANLEVSIDDQFVYHTEGLRFSADPRLLDGVKNAGIDFLSIANNHIGDSGNDGFTEVREELGARGIAFSGAGANEAEAREFAVLMTNGIRVAVIGCDAIAKYYWADSSSPGSASCKGDAVSTQIRSAREVADIVIVYPHWGTEYTSNPNTGQRNRARQWIEAGADMIIGNHAHWTAAMEEIDGKLAFYALGNFVFDQMWQEQTMEGMLLELTFHGTELVQAWLHPTLVIDSAQPNFMDPEGDGRIVLDRVRDASRGLLSY